jgi:hypothetical protein
MHNRQSEDCRANHQPIRETVFCEVKEKQMVTLDPAGGIFILCYSSRDASSCEPNQILDLVFFAIAAQAVDLIAKVR